MQPDEPEIDTEGLCVDVGGMGIPCESETVGNPNLNLCIRADGGVVSDIGNTTGLSEQAGLACVREVPGASPAPENPPAANPPPANPAPEQAPGASAPVQQAEPAEAIVQEPSFTG